MSTAAPPRPGRFGAFGGRYVAETLVPALVELTDRHVGGRDGVSGRAVDTSSAGLSQIARFFLGVSHMTRQSRGSFQG